MNLFLCILTQIYAVLQRKASMMINPNDYGKPYRILRHPVVLSNYFTINLFRTMRCTLRKIAWTLPLLIFAFALQAQDLALGMRSSVTSTSIGSQVTFTIAVYNEDITNASGVTVISAVPLGSTFFNENSGGAYNSGTGLWTVGNIAAGDSAKLNITVTVNTDGVLFSTAEITTSDNPDPDSTPGNGSILEDDWSSACITVPMHFNCRDDINVLATAQAGYTDYQWYLNGSPIAGAHKDTFRILAIGDYTYTASTLGTSCPASLCCPISVVRDSCLSLGNLVFDDKDNNGLFDGTDTGIDGVQVQLWSVGLDNLKGTFDDVLDSTITTAGGGFYLFGNLNPGLYYVQLPGIGVPTDYVSSTGGGINGNSVIGIFEPGSSNETVDNDDNGTKMSGSSMIMSDTIRLVLNGEPTSEDGSANSNLTIDFGLYPPVCVQPDISAVAQVVVCNPSPVDLSTITVTDNNNVTGALSYFATALDAVNNTNPLSNTLISGVGSATYWIRKEGSFASCFDTVSVVITINAKPAYADGFTTVCEGERVDLTSLITGYVGIFNPTWTIGGQAVTNPTQVISVLSVNTYTFIGENASGCKDTALVILTVYAKPNAGPDQYLTCIGVNAPSSYNFGRTGTWSVLTQPLGALASVNGSGLASGMTIPGQYNFELDKNGCKDTVAVIIPDCSCTKPNISVVNPIIDVCAPIRVDVSAITVTDAANVSGTLSYHATASDAVTGANPLSNTTVSTVGTKTMWIRKIDGTGFCYDTLSVVVSIRAKPVITDAATTVCENTVVDLTSLITNYGSIVNPKWTQDGNTVVDATHVPPSVGTTIYRLIGENAVGCKDTADVAVTVYAKPNVGADISLNCSSGSTHSTVDFAYVGTWTILTQPVGASATINGFGQAVGLTVDGLYTFEIDVNGCKDTVKVSVQICLNLGNLVWHDTNNNGIKDGTETGLADIQVQLYASTDTIKGNNDDVLLATQLTDANGNYLFLGLNAGNYYVKLINVPDSLVSSTGGGIYDQDGAGDYEPSTVGDVNEEDHGTGMPNHIVMSKIVNLVINGEPTNDGDSDPNTNLTVDFGLYVPRDTPIFDLALVKKLETRGSGVVVNNGDVVRFNMTIYNQGNTNAYDVKISDYIPVGLEYNTALNTAAATGNVYDWQADSTLLVGSIAVGQSITVGIILGVNHSALDTILVNKSEILFATAVEGSGILTPDVDSQADNDPDNDIVGGDDIINNGRNDEDDHDYGYVIDYIDHDPIGHIYCDKSGKIVTGGQISVVGPGLIYIIEDGHTGRYQFYTDGTPGTYTMSYSHPNGYPMSTTCVPQTDTLNTSTADGSPIDKDGLVNGKILLGSDINGGYMIDKNCSANTYYFNINITSGTDPFVFNNNFPVQCSSIGALTCKDNNYNSILDLSDTPVDSIKVYLEDCLTSTVIDSTISMNGKYLFDGLSSGTYRVHADLPSGYRFALQNVGGNESIDSDVDSLGYSACITLNFGECDTTNAQICLIPNIYELALRKTLGGSQSPQVSVGDTVTYSIVVKNRGSINAYDVDVIDSLPAHLTLIDSNWTSMGSKAIHRIPILAFGDSTTVTIKTRVNSSTTSIINYASVRGSDRTGGVVRDEVTLDNNKDSVGVTLRLCTATPDFTTSHPCATVGINFTPLSHYLTWDWRFGDGFSSTDEHATHIYPTAGNYNLTLIVTDSNGCTGSITKQITVQPMVWAYAGINRTICEGDSVNLHAQGGTHYIWTAGVSSLNDMNSANPIATPSVTTTYVVQVSNDYGCFANATVTVNVIPKPIIISRTGDLSTCTNGVMPVRITLNQAITSYDITGNASWRNVVVSGDVLSFEAVLNGSYNNMHVLLKGANGCSVSDSFHLYLAANPRAEFIVVEPFCNNAEMTLLFTGQASPAATIDYNLDGGIIVHRSMATLTRPYGDTTIVKYPTFGSKLINLVVNDGGCTDGTTKSIFVRKSPKTVISYNDTTICVGTCANLYGTAGILDCVYSWTPATGLSATNIANPIACPLVPTTYYLTIMDINGCQSTDSVKILINNNPRPILAGVPANITVNCNTIPSPATVTEINGATVTLAEVRTNGNCTNNYKLTRTWTATDVCNQTDVGTQIVTIQDLVAPTLLGIIPNITVACVSEIPAAVINVTAIDACDSNPIISFVDAVSNETCANRKTISRVWTVTDACVNSRTGSQRITVFDNIAPIFTNVPADITIECDAPQPNVLAIATDNCGSPTITVNNTTNGSGCSYTITRTFTASDSCGNKATALQIVTVQDKTAPTFSNCPANITVASPSEVPSTPTLTATDNCTNSVTVTMTETRANTGNNCDSILTRTWGAVDICGNSSTCQQLITVGSSSGTNCNCILPVATLQKNDATCGAANGTATINVDNVANYNFNWSTGINFTNTHTGLAAGIYSVTVSRKSDTACFTVISVPISNNTFNCCASGFIAQSSLIKVITDCNSTAEVCVEIPANTIASFTITDNGIAYRGGFGLCNAGSTIYLQNGNHIIIFTTPDACKDTLIVKVTCSQEIRINRTVTFPKTDSICLTAAQLGLTGNIVSIVNDCAGNTHYTDISINPISHCIIYKALNIGVDSACLFVTTSTGGTAYVKLIITVQLSNCGSLIPQDSVIITDACTANPKVCVNIPFDVVPDFNILLNGTAYTGSFDACKYDTTFAYTYFTIPGRGTTGPYRIDYWTVNGTTHSAASVNTMNEVVALMNGWDPTGNWMLSSSSLTILGGDHNKIYSGMKLTRIANGSYGIMELNTNIIPMGTVMDIPRGHSTIVFINRNTGCADTLTINAACLTPQYIESAIYVGDKDTFCIATNELIGTRYRISKLVPSTNNFARFTDVSGTTCVSRTGLIPGVEKATYVISDEFGMNDTTYVTTHVFVRYIPRPKANPDTASTIKAKPVLIDVLSNDSLNANNWTLTITTNPKHGQAIVTADMRIIYIPDIDYCNSRVADVFTYSLCTLGGCDTTKVEVIVSCDKIKIYNGFSPNNDGINDVFVIEGIEKFPNNTLSVFNRWGNEVMKTKGYKNDWDGTWNNQILPDGTYFYIFEDGEGNKTVGYVQIMR